MSSDPSFLRGMRGEQKSKHMQINDTIEERLQQRKLVPCAFVSHFAPALDVL